MQCQGIYWLFPFLFSGKKCKLCTWGGTKPTIYKWNNTCWTLLSNAKCFSKLLNYLPRTVIISVEIMKINEKHSIRKMIKNIIIIGTSILANADKHFWYLTFFLSVLKNESRFHHVISLQKKFNCHMVRKSICFLSSYSWRFFSHWINSTPFRPQEVTCLGAAAPPRHLWDVPAPPVALAVYILCSCFLRETCIFNRLLVLSDCLRLIWSQATDLDIRCGILYLFIK